ncbi:MAG TPA: CopG family transcriptional regulator [Herpetosiphonaceae bacterium]
MATIKTAISLQDSLFEQVEGLARDMNVSRSQLVALALEEFVRRHQNQQLLESINRAYESTAEPDDPDRTSARRQHHRRMVEEEW